MEPTSQRLALPDPRYAAIEQLQAITRVASPGTQRFDEADLGISLALNRTRALSPPEFFTRNVRRDARRVYRRKRRTLTLSALCPSDLSTSERNCSIDDLVGPARTPPPDLECATAEFQENIRDSVGQIADASACLEGMLLDEAPAETASRLGLPERRVYYLRHRIRTIVRRLLTKETNGAW